WARPGLIWYCGSPQKRGARHHPESERPTLRQEPWPAARNGLDLNGALRHRTVIPRLPESGPVPLPFIPETAMADDITSETAQTVAAGQLRAFIERIERLEEEKKTISDDIKEVYAEMKGNGFDVKAVRTIVRLRKKDQAERQEEEAILELYKAALGMV